MSTMRMAPPAARCICARNPAGCAMASGSPCSSMFFFGRSVRRQNSPSYVIWQEPTRGDAVVPPRDMAYMTRPTIA